MILISVPDCLSINIINSQIFGLFNYLNITQDVHLLCNDNIKGKLKSNGEVSFVSKDDNKNSKQYLRRANIVYCRHQVDFLKLLALRKVNNYKFKIFYDFRGVASSESFLRSSSLIKSKILHYFDKFIYRNTDDIGAVSLQLKKYLCAQHGERVIHVVPCCNNDVYKRKYAPREVHLPIKFVYVGGMSKWQKFEKILNLFTDIAKCHNAQLTVITSQPEVAKLLIIKKNIEDVTLLSLPQVEVSRELQKHDFGFLIRDDLILNRCASPIKLLEYVGAGVFPLISSCVGDYAGLVKKNNIGLIEDELVIGDPEQFLSLLEEREAADRLFDFGCKYKWKNSIDKIHPLLREINEN